MLLNRLSLSAGMLAFVLLLFNYPIRAQVIVTVAGTGVAGYTGDGGAATAATLNIPAGIAFDKGGNLLIADQQNSVIRKVDVNTGIITTIAGTGAYPGDGRPANQAGLSGPTGIAVDGAGNILIVEEYGSIVRKVDAVTGKISTIAGVPAAGFNYSGDGGPATGAGFYQPTGIALDATGNIYIADWQNNVIRKINAATGIISTAVGYYPGWSGYTGNGGPANRASLYAPPRLSFDPAGNMLIGDQGNNVIRKVGATTGIIQTIAGNNIAGYAGDGGPSISARLNQPSAVISDAGGNIFIADSYNNVIRKVDAVTGVISTIAGNGAQGYSGDGGLPLNASFYRPVDMAFDASGNLYIADARNNVVRKITFCLAVKPSVTISQTPATFCTTNPVFTANTVNGGPSPVYQWQMNGVNAGTNSPAYTASNAADGATVTCTVTSSAQCATPRTVTSNPITVKGALMGRLIDNGAGCAGDTLRLRSSNSLAQIDWYNGATLAGQVDTTIVATTPGSYSATITGKSGCTMTTNAIVVKPTVVPTVSINASVTGICAGGAVSFTATPANGGSTPGFQWQVNGLNAGTNAAIFTSTTLADKDVITCRLASDARCPLPASVRSNSIAITVNPPPQINPMPDISLPAGQSITLDPLVMGNVQTYSWTPGSWLSDSTVRDPVASPPKTALYALTVTTPEGCNASGTVKVVVFTKLRLPNAFTPNGDGRNDVFYVLGGPPGCTIKDLSVYDRWGVKVFQVHDVAPADPSFGWNGLYAGTPAPPGTYVYSLIIRYADGSQQHFHGTVILVR